MLGMGSGNEVLEDSGYYEVSRILPPLGHYRVGHLWAQPDVNAAAGR